MSTQTDPEIQEIRGELPKPHTGGVEQPVSVEVASEKQSSQKMELDQPAGHPPQQPQDSAHSQPKAISAVQPTDTSGVSGTTNSPGVGSMPQIADDTDLIEKEWVEKAKDIVERTKSDPRARNREINKLKAEYLKKRYNKDLKLDDNQ